MLALARFDVRSGHQLVWTSEQVEPGSLPGLEFKMLPSGLHERQEDTIYFVCGRRPGLAVYRSQTGTEDGTEDIIEGTVDRSNTHMYSLALLVPEGQGIPWNQETFLKHELAKFMDVRDTMVLTRLGLGAPDTRGHPVLATPRFLDTYGALVFELWKAGLSRQRLLLAHPRNRGTLRDLSQFSYIVSRLGSMPSDVQHLLPDHRRGAAAEYPCWYTVGLMDMSRLQSAEVYCGATTDGLLLSPSREACDVWTDACSLHLSSGDEVRPTWRDRRRFSRLVDKLGVDYHPLPHQCGNMSWGGVMDRVVDSVATGLMWWASAGESAVMNAEAAEHTRPLLRSDEPDGVALLGVFQGYTRQLVRVFSKLAQDDEGVIVVGPEHIAAMGLDPVAQQDRRFLQRFSLVWWDRPVCFRGCCC